MTYFDCCKVPLIMRAIDLIDQGTVPQTYHEFSQDFMVSILRLYAHYNSEEVFSIREFGTFFPEVLRDTGRYIFAQPELRRSLERLKNEGKVLFLATNSHVEYMEVIMEASLGEDWKSLFDLSCANCRKPGYFSKEEAFKQVDQSVPTWTGLPITETD